MTHGQDSLLGQCLDYDQCAENQTLCYPFQPITPELCVDQIGMQHRPFFLLLLSSSTVSTPAPGSFHCLDCGLGAEYVETPGWQPNVTALLPCQCREGFANHTQQLTWNDTSLISAYLGEYFREWFWGRAWYATLKLWTRFKTIFKYELILFNTEYYISDMWFNTSFTLLLWSGCGDINECEEGLNTTLGHNCDNDTDIQVCQNLNGGFRCCTQYCCGQSAWPNPTYWNYTTGQWTRRTEWNHPYNKGFPCNSNTCTIKSHDDWGTSDYAEGINTRIFLEVRIGYHVELNITDFEVRDI